MALFAKSFDAARADLAKAEATVKEWENKDSTARAELERLNSTAGEMIVNNPASADTVSQQIQSLERQARTAGLALAGARANLLEAHRSMLEAEARHEDKLQAAAAKELDKHQAKVADALAKLQELNYAEYRVQICRDESGNLDIIRNWPQSTKADELHGVRDGHTYRAMVIREFLDTGEIHNNNFSMGDLPGLVRFDTSKHVPDSVRVAKAAGLAPKQTVEA